MKMNIENESKSYWLPGLNREVIISRGQEIDEDSPIGLELKKYYIEDVATSEGKSVLAEISTKLKGINSSASEIDAGIAKANSIQDISAVVSGLTMTGSDVSNALNGHKETIESISIHGLVDNFLVSAVTGVVSANTSYKTSNYIPVENNMQYTYNGFFTLDTGIAGYDENHIFVAKVARGADINVNGVFTHTFTITNPSIKYIRCALKKTVAPSMTLTNDVYTSLEDIKTDIVDIKTKTKDDIYLTFGTNEFSAFILNEKNEYLQHRFKYKNSTQFNDVGWYSDSVLEKGNEIVQGNIHVVAIVRKDVNSDDNIYIGHGHGCEEELYSNFYLDGVEFNPLTQTTTMYGKELKIVTYSKYYRPNRTNSLAVSTEFTVAQLPLEMIATRFSEIVFTKLNKIDKKHILKSLVSGLLFRELFTSMQQTNMPYFNGKIITNDRDGTRNYFPNSPDAPMPIPPSAVMMNGINYGNKNSFCDTVIADGNYNGTNYLCSTKMTNKDSSLNSKVNVRAWCTRTTSNKFYFIPINTFSMQEASGITADVFNIGDTISTIATTKISVKQ